MEIINQTKSKSIIIDGNLHDKFKLSCKNKCMKIGAAIEDLIKLYLSNPKTLQKMIDDLKENKQEVSNLIAR